ncbi:hypothetical protein [Streptomyces sp. NBC_01408]|uniref:hypothetical protein n=1 Tax=Streptomyces sp. NBC_01408 TaxID=2903855 RepID=UPI00225837F7|nr:hypothetical protein [Streptomyces sp. NBC_01408]MCX4693557.1 hypothetical protein [Streptomyces sp. NBC_01408]
MRKSLVAALVTAVTAVLSVGTGPPANAASEYCTQTTPNTSMLLYNDVTGAAVSGTLAAGRWQQKAAFTLPEDYTSAAVSRDSLLLWNAFRGEGESGTFTDGKYTRVKVFDDALDGWHYPAASGDSVLLYKPWGDRVMTGTLKNGVYQQVREYDDIGEGWQVMGSSCDTMVFVKSTEQASGDDLVSLTYGTLQNGVYTQVGSRDGDAFLADLATENGDLIATKDSVLAFSPTDAEFVYKVGTATDGKVSAFRDGGTSGVWETVSRTADSVLFYNRDGTARTSTLSGGHYADVGPLAGLSPHWSIIAGGV